MDMPTSNPNLPNPNLGPASPGPEAPHGPMPEQFPAPAAGETAQPANSGAPVAGTPAPSSNTPVPDPMALAMGQPRPTVNSAGGATPAPNVADDVDVIEPEWVDKAEQVVETHRGDPYGEEEAIEDLQIDYLQKRYGFSVKKPDADNSKPGTP